MAVAPSRRNISFGREGSSLTLEDLLGEARDAFAAELYIPLTVEQPPALRTRGADGQWVTHAAFGAQVGVSMSAQLARRLSNPEDEYGNVFPVARALDDIRGWCKGNHLQTSRGPWLDHAADITAGAVGTDLWDRLRSYRPLCGRLAYFSVAHRVPLDRLARQEQISLTRAGELLQLALAHAFMKRRDWAHADESGVTEVLAAQRRERREARRRAQATAEGSVCRYCARLYDPRSEDPCPGSDGHRINEAEAATYAAIGVTLLCSPATPAA